MDYFWKQKNHRVGPRSMSLWKTGRWFDDVLKFCYNHMTFVTFVLNMYRYTPFYICNSFQYQKVSVVFFLLITWYNMDHCAADLVFFYFICGIIKIGTIQFKKKPNKATLKNDKSTLNSFII